GVCIDSALENGYVQLAVWAAESVDGKAGAAGSALACQRCLCFYLLHGSQPVAGASLYDHDYGWRAPGGGSSYYESAILDGANWFQRAIYITIPEIKGIIAPSVLITVFTTFKQFDVVYLLTQQSGARTGANIHTILTYAHENAFITNNYGYSSAVSMIIFIVLIAFSLLTNRKRKEE